MPHIALIACGHGLGHTRRLLVLSQALCGRNCAVTIFAPARASKRLVQVGYSLDASVEIVDFDTETSAERLQTDPSHADRWLAKLPELDGYDIVVSDNLPEILEIRPGAVLSGHFFWHLALKNIAPEYADRCEALLGAYRPRMIATYLVVDDRLKDHDPLDGPSARPLGIHWMGPRDLHGFQNVPDDEDGLIGRGGVPSRRRRKDFRVRFASLAQEGSGVLGHSAVGKLREQLSSRGRRLLALTKIQ